MVSQIVLLFPFASCQGHTAAAKMFKRIEEEGVPYVLLDRAIPGVKAHFVGSDDKAIGAIATQHLIDRGYPVSLTCRSPASAQA